MKADQIRQHILVGLCLFISTFWAQTLLPLLLGKPVNIIPFAYLWATPTVVWLFTIAGAHISEGGRQKIGIAQRAGKAVFWTASLDALAIVAVASGSATRFGHTLAAAVLHYLLMLVIFPFLEQLINVLKPCIYVRPPSAEAQMTLQKRWLNEIQVPLLVGSAGMVLIQSQVLGGHDEQETKSMVAMQELTTVLGNDAELLDTILSGPQSWFAPELGFATLTLLGLILVLATTTIFGRLLVKGVVGDLEGLRRSLDTLVEDATLPKDGNTVTFSEGREVLQRFQNTWKGLAEGHTRLQSAQVLDEHAAREKSLVLAHVTHELKNPLNAMLGFAEMNLAELNGPVSHEAQLALNAIWETCDQMLRRIIALLELSRLEEAEAVRANASQVERAVAEISAQILIDHIDESLRKHPLGRKVIFTEARTNVALGNKPKVDCAMTARVLQLLSWMVLDESAKGEVKLVAEDQADGLMITLKTIGGSHSHHAHKLSLPTDMQGHDARTIYHRLMDALVRIQGGTFRIKTNDGDYGWEYLLPHP